MPSGGLAFGRFRLDLPSKQLYCDDSAVDLPPRYAELLALLASRAGEVVSRDQVMESVWQSVISENSLEQAVSRLRRVLEQGGGTERIETVRSAGYRFVGTVSRIEARLTVVDVDALLTPYRSLSDGRAAIEHLVCDEFPRARVFFAERVERHPGEARFHIGLANACIFQFEATRADDTPDIDARDFALRHAHSATTLDEANAEAWATLGFVLARTSRREDALAALRRSVSLDPNIWQHHLRLSSVSWGGERLSAAQQTLRRLPDCALAHLLMATVFIACGAFDEADRQLDAGLDAIASDSRQSSVAFHWLKGLLLLARGDELAALASFEQELELESRGHLYARECCANAWSAIGAIRLRQGDRPGARAAFEEAVTRVPRLPMAHAGLALTGAPRMHEDASSAPLRVDVAMAKAAVIAASGDEAAAVELVSAALSAAPGGNAGWLLPVDPLLNVQRHEAQWRPVLATVRGRAN
jgi:DNA-binding winged helix-turn-helix (wHTH) protein/Tfp pilus assembly protein PilF